MWAVGCIFYELFKKKPLFPGLGFKASIHLSGKEPTNQRDFQEDQLSKIFSVLGMIDKDSWRDVSETKNYGRIKDVKLYVALKGELTIKYSCWLGART